MVSETATQPRHLTAVPHPAARDIDALVRPDSVHRSVYVDETNRCLHKGTQLVLEGCRRSG